MVERQENRFLYMLKGIACLAVILLHTSLPPAINGPLRALARFAVPMFFIITGRYLPSDRAALRKRLKKTALLTANVWVVCMLWTLAQMLINGGLVEWLKMCFTPGEWMRLLLFNSGLCIAVPPTYSDFMWYLFALIYVDLLAMLTVRWRPQAKNALCVALLVGFFALQYAMPGRAIPLLGISANDPRPYRNFLFLGMSFTLLGEWIARTDKRPRSIVLILTAAFGGVLAVAETVLIAERELTFGAAAMTVALALLAERFPGSGSRALAYVGKYLSARVYCWHILVLGAVTLFIAPGIPQDFRFPLVAALSLLLAFGLHILGKKFKR